ncbi:hypothetical protein QTJ16_006015 [Diplocarpon rosae]|uniref:HTH APSES-type domain-containing protein n=1 Tax=Diplocarpon rosae TaxID=946125 RepID=A0AAD9SWI8_9HELO|nr:hypothetical protein QTJ16_006015 [Diplocarpon rosae]PBP18693.1 APSES transcription factor StuA [Diplocarpon rosae]
MASEEPFLHVSPYGPPTYQGSPQPYSLQQPEAPQHQSQEDQTSNQYPQYSYNIRLSYPQDPSTSYPPLPGQSQAQRLPPMTMLGQENGDYIQQGMNVDTTGQIAPLGAKPRVTATLWEDEGTLCFQVDINGTCVARREGDIMIPPSFPPPFVNFEILMPQKDNHMINGTKLLNVAGMTRGRRDGLLKSEKQKHVVKIGPMHLKGVWIPYERALDFANKEKITERLYPLFVHNISALLYHPNNRAGYPPEAHVPRSQESPHNAGLGGPFSNAVGAVSAGQPGS